MTVAISKLITAAALAGLVAGCSSDGGIMGSSLTTSSVDNTKVAAAAAPKADPACLGLTAKIDALRKDGVTERVEKASSGKTTTVSVKRESLAKMTELDKANADYQAKCSAAGLAKPMAVAPAAAAAVPVAAAPAAKPAAAVAKKAVAAVAPKPAVVVAPPAAVAPAAAAIAPPAPVAVPVPVAPVPAAP
jgi:hypothetical protein